MNPHMLLEVRGGDKGLSAIVAHMDLVARVSLHVLDIITAV